MADTVDTPPAGFWLSVTELAKNQNVSKQAIARKLAALEADGLVKTKPGKGKTKLVNVAQYLTAIGQAGNVAQELAAADRAADAAALDAPEANSPPAYRDAQTRDKELSADLKELELKQKLGEVVPVENLSALATEVAEQIVRVIDRLPAKAQDMASAVARDGEVGARGQYKRDVRELREAIAEALGKLADSKVALPPEPDDESAPPPAPHVP